MKTREEYLKGVKTYPLYETIKDFENNIKSPADYYLMPINGYWSVMWEDEEGDSLSTMTDVSTINNYERTGYVVVDKGGYKTLVERNANIDIKELNWERDTRLINMVKSYNQMSGSGTLYFEEMFNGIMKEYYVIYSQENGFGDCRVFYARKPSDYPHIKRDFELFIKSLLS